MSAGFVSSIGLSLLLHLPNRLLDFLIGDRDASRFGFLELQLALDHQGQRHVLRCLEATREGLTAILFLNPLPLRSEFPLDLGQHDEVRVDDCDDPIFHLRG